MIIESAQNQTFKRLLKLHKKKYRQQEQLFIVEGMHLVEEALKFNVVKTILLKASIPQTIAEIDELECLVLKDSLFDQLAQTPSPQPIMAICEMKQLELTQLNRLLICDEVQDPGNLGTLIRSALAFGFDGIILGEGCVDVFNEKVVRSTQGAIFKLPIIHANLEEMIPTLKRQNVRVYGTSVTRAYPLQDVVKEERMAFILGNEGNGVHPKHLTLTDHNIYIEMSPLVESLNVSIAGSIIMHQFRP